MERVMNDEEERERGREGKKSRDEKDSQQWRWRWRGEASHVKARQGRSSSRSASYLTFTLLYDGAMPESEPEPELGRVSNGRRSSLIQLWMPGNYLS